MRELGTPAADHDHRLAAGQPVDDPRELAGVADRLEVQQDEVGRGILLPVLEEVVAGDVRPVAGRHEARHPEAALGEPLEDRAAQRARLAEEADATAGRHGRHERRVQPHLGVGVDDAEGVRADEAHAGAGDRRDELAPAAPRSTRRRGRAPRQLAGVGEEVGHLRGGDDHDDEIDRARRPRRASARRGRPPATPPPGARPPAGPGSRRRRGCAGSGNPGRCRSSRPRRPRRTADAACGPSSEPRPGARARTSPRGWPPSARCRTRRRSRRPPAAGSARSRRRGTSTASGCWPGGPPPRIS